MRQTHRLIHSYTLTDTDTQTHTYLQTRRQSQTQTQIHTHEHKKLNNTHYHRMHPTDNKERLDDWLTSDEIPHTKPHTQPKRFWIRWNFWLCLKTNRYHELGVMWWIWESVVALEVPGAGSCLIVEEKHSSNQLLSTHTHSHIQRQRQRQTH